MLSLRRLSLLLLTPAQHDHIINFYGTYSFDIDAELRRDATDPCASLPDPHKITNPPGLVRLLSWVRSLANLNEFFVHHEHVRRANGLGPRNTLAPGLQNALWRNVLRSGRYLSRRLRDAGLEIAWSETERHMTARRAAPFARLVGPPGELLLYLFGRQAAARVDVTGPPEAVEAVRHTHFGM